MMQITVITGAIGCGKTTRLDAYRKRAPKAAGIIARGLYESQNEKFKYGYELESLKTGERRLLLTSSPKSHLHPVGRFFMDPDVLEWAKTQLLEGMNAPMLVLDELGPLELEGGGYYDTFRTVLSSYQGELVLVIRSSILERMLHRLNLDFNQVHLIPVTHKEQ
jgi:nucleoside-triphosphatase THEP1